MNNGRTPTDGPTPPGLRERMTRANEFQALPPEILDSLLTLPDRLTLASKKTFRMLADQERSLSETERNIAHTTEILRKQADRITRMQTGVILLALIAGTLGGTAAALIVLHWMP